MKPAIRISGKAKQVFKYIELMGQHKGKVTLGELTKGDKIINIKLDKL